MGHSNAFHPPCENHDTYILQLEDSTEAIEMIMDMYGEEMKRLVYTYLKNTADTDDVTQEVFVTIYQKLHAFQGKSSLRSWIYSVAINKCKDHLRSWQSRNKRLKERLSQSVSVFSVRNETPETFLIRHSESNELLSHVMALPIKYREVIILYYFEELASKEISQILHVSDTAVRTRLNRGREKLKQRLAAESGGSLG